MLSLTVPQKYGPDVVVVPMADTVLLDFETAAMARVDAAVDHRVDHVSTSCLVHHMQAELAHLQLHDVSHKSVYTSSSVWA